MAKTNTKLQKQFQRQRVQFCCFSKEEEFPKQDDKSEDGQAGDYPRDAQSVYAKLDGVQLDTMNVLVPEVVVVEVVVVAVIVETLQLIDEIQLNFECITRRLNYMTFFIIVLLHIILITNYTII